MNKKKLIIVVIITVLIATAMVIGVLFFKTYHRNQSIQEVINLVENEQIEDAIEIVNEDLGDNDEESLKQQLKEYVESMQNQFLDGTLEYTIAETRIQAIEKMGLFGEQEFDEIHEKMKTVNESNINFRNGQEAVNNKQYANALRDLKKVIKEDKNYEAAQSMIETVIANYKEEIEKEVESLVEKQNYEEVFSLIEEGLEILENDTDLSALMSKYKDEYVAEEMKQAEALAAEESYEDAIKQIQNASEFIEDENFTNELESLKEKYENWAIAKAKQMAEQWQYEDAVDLLTSVNVIVNSDNLKTTIEEYKQHQKVELYDMTIVDSEGMELEDGAVLDTYGNEYTKAYVYYNSSAFSLHNIKGNYRRFVATVAPSKSMSSSTIVYFEFYGGTTKDDLKLIGKTEQFGKTSEAISVEVDVTGCKLLEIRKYKAEGGYSDAYLTNAYLQ